MVVRANIGQEDIPVESKRGFQVSGQTDKEHLETDIGYGQGGPRGK